MKSIESMKWFHSVRTRLRLLFARRSAESRMNDEFLFHIEMETDRLVRAKGLAPHEARRQALASFGGVEKHKEAMRDGRGLAWLSGLSLDVKLGGRMLLKYPSLTLAGGLALAIAIGIGAGWYDVVGKILAPTLPLPEGDRLVSIETQNTLTNAPERRVSRDFLEWRRELRTLEDLGAYRADSRNLMFGDAASEPFQVAELTAAAFRAARVQPQLGRALLDADEAPGAPRVVVLGYDVWQRSLGGRPDIVGSIVKLGNTPATVIGVMPEGFAYPLNHDVWTPLSLGATYAALDGGGISVVGRLAPGVTLEQADAELRVIGARAAAALPATHAHLRPRVMRFGNPSEFADFGQFAAANLPALLVLSIACMTVGTLVYARTATREGEIALRSALGASRGRIIGQLFVEVLVLAVVAAAVGLVAADRVMTWGIESINRANGGAPFWMTPGLKLTTILYAGGLAIVSAALLSLLPALKVTRARVQSHLANGGAGGATLRFGRIWTGAMIGQVALTAIGIPAGLETINEVRHNVNIRAEFPSRDSLAARIGMDAPFEEEAATFEERRARTFAALEQRIAQEPGVIAVTFTDRAPGGSAARTERGEMQPSPGKPAYEAGFATTAVGPGFFDVFERPIVAGRTFHASDWNSGARTVIVNEAYARQFSRTVGRGSPIGTRVRSTASSSSDRPDASAEEPWLEIVGVVRDFNLDPNDHGDERPFVFRPASVATISPLVINVRVRGNPAPLAARLPVIAANVDPGLFVQDSQSLAEWIRRRDMELIVGVGIQTAVTMLVLFLSALGIFSLVSVSVSRRTREIGVRTALGAQPRHVLAGIVSRAIVLMGSGIAVGGVILLSFVANAWSTADVALYAGYLAVTSAVMLTACLLACIGPARRALNINPTDALKDA
jgi:predicted permease